MSSRNARLRKIRQLIAEEGTPILLTQQKNVSWLSGGRSHVNLASEPGCCQYLVTRDECILIVNNIEAKRLEQEEIGADLLAEIDRIEVWDWFHPGDRERIVRTHVGQAQVKTDVELEGQFLGMRSVIETWMS